ncbi:MAG TPA: multicopper oxidase family protein [Longimicrobiales bacterium]|nr:multicopper oxidase family protein [Longimicrobiales bacterium]
MATKREGKGDGTDGGRLDRRSFLRIGAAGLVVAGGSAAVAVLAGRGREAGGPGPQVDGVEFSRTPMRQFRLRAAPLEWDVGTGHASPAWGYEGRVPGPEIRVREGERVRIVLENGLPEPTTIHWHGLPVPHAMDGVPELTQEAVPPGGTFVYEFVAGPAGTYWYHSHAPYQLDRGLFGPLVVEPGREPLDYDREQILVFDDWLLDPDHPRPDPNAAGGMMGMMEGMGGMRGMMRGGAETHVEGVRAQPLYDAFTVNGVLGTEHAPIEVRRGERLRLRLINASASHVVPVRVAGHRLTITHSDGRPVEPFTADTVLLGMGERYDVLVQMTNPGTWALESLNAAQRAAGLRVPIRYAGARGSATGVSETGLVARYSDLRGLEGTESRRPDRVYDLELSGGMMRGPTVWTINGRRYPDTEPLEVVEGERVRVRLFNMSMMPHPMHLHGHFFDVVAPDGRPAGRPIRKDTVVLDHMQTHVIEFTADNPGPRWFFHCHNIYHQHGGMATEVRYRT